MGALKLILATLAICAIAHGEYQASIYGMQALKLYCDTDEKLEFVHQHEDLPGFDVLKLLRDESVPVEILVAPDRLKEFKQALDEKQIEYEVYIEDFSKVIEQEISEQEQARNLRTSTDISEDISFESFPTYSEIKNYLQHLTKKFSNIVETFSIGKSYEGRDIVGIKISNGPAAKHAIVIDAGIHAREWIAPTTALYAIHQLVENTTNHYLFNDIDIYVIPSLNVDGYEYTHLNAGTRLWRKTRSNWSGHECVGVDANRNFDMAWLTIGASPDPCSGNYAGPKAFSEPEAVALSEFILSLGDKFKSYVSLHSSGNLIMHPWGHIYELPKNSPTLKCIADRAASEAFKVRETRFKTGNSIVVIYPTSGSSSDWAYGKAKAEASYVIELTDGFGHVVPPREILPVGRETFEAIKIFIKFTAGQQVC